jgi:hypothetical protein
MKFEPAKIWTPGSDVWDLCPEHRSNVIERVGMKGIFTPELLCAKSGELVQRAIAPNEILDRAIDVIFLGAHPRHSYNSMAVGTNGSPTAPSVDLGVKNLVSGGLAPYNITPGVTPYTMDSVDWEEYGWIYTAYWPSAYGNGELAEVGMTGTNTTYFVINYLNRALFKDEEGNQITIPKDSGHVLRITMQMAFRFNRFD